MCSESNTASGLTPRNRLFSFGARRSGPTAVLLLACAALPLAGPLAAQTVWKRQPAVDPASLNEVDAAVATNDEGSRFALFIDRSTPGRILGAFYLATADQDFLDQSRPPALQIDSAPPQRLVRLSGELKSVGVLLWPGPDEPVVGLVRDLMNGADMVVEYPLSGGGFKEARFELVDARETVAEALGIAAEVSQETQDLARAQEQSVTACFQLAKKKQQERCLKSLGECLAQAPGSADQLLACVAESG